MEKQKFLSQLKTVGDYVDAIIADVEADVTSPTPEVPAQPGETAEVMMTQAEYDAKIAEAKQAGIDEAVASDTTKFSDEDLAAQKAELQAEFEKISEEKTAALKEKIEALELELSQKDADALEEATADLIAETAAAMMKKAQELRDRTPAKGVEPVPAV